MSKVKVIVTGEPRSGTSLMMQTLEKLGVPVAGEKVRGEDLLKRRLQDLKDKSNSSIHERNQISALERRIDRMQNLNPKGFYEIPNVVMRGFSKVQTQWKNKAIKVITSGFYERTLSNGKIIGVNTDLFEKVILCLRDPKHISQSQTGLSMPVEVATEDKTWQMEMMREINPRHYLEGMGRFVIWLKEHYYEIFDKTLVVDYAEMMQNPPIDLIAFHLGITPTQEQIQAARDNIDPTLYRSKRMAGWPKKLEMAGLLCERIYDTLKSFHLEMIQALAADLEDYFSYEVLEKIRWTDDRLTWVDVQADLYRSILNPQEKLQEQLIQSLQVKRKAKLIPDRCKYYKRSHDHFYDTKRPVDLGVLKRPMVDCGRDKVLKTVETCKFCWLRGSIVDGVPLPPERSRQT